MKDRTQSGFTFGWLGGLLLFMGMMAGSLVASVLMSLLMSMLPANSILENFNLLITNACGFLGAIFAFDYFMVRPQTGKKLSFNMSTANFGTYLLIFPMMAGMMLIAEFFTNLIPTTGPFFGPAFDIFQKLMDRMTTDPATLVVLAVFMAPLFEEIVFRGIIQKGLIRKGMKPMYAILLSAVLFGVVHANPWQFVGAVLLGCVMGLVYYKTKSLLMPILLHAFNNLISSLLIFYTASESISEATGLKPYFLLAIGIIIFALFTTIFLRRNRIHYREND